MGIPGTTEVVRLADLGEFRNGVNFEKAHKGTGLGLINVKDIFRDSPSIDLESLDKVDLSAVRGIERFFVEKGDLFFVRSSVKRDGIGYVAYADRRDHSVVHCGFVIRFRPVGSRVDYRFLTYALRTPQARAKIQNLSGGAAITNISQQCLGAFPLELPPLVIQRRITGVLSSYDELIENNLKRIGIIEKMARTLYHEWFVALSPPAGEGKTAPGDLPKGWKRVPLRTVVEINPRVSVPREGQKPFVPMSALETDSMIIRGFEQRVGNSGAKFQNGDTLFARITPSLENGKTGFVQFLSGDESVAFGSTEFIVLRSKTLTPEFVYLLSRTDKFRGTAIRSMSGASGRQRVQERCFDSVSVVQPPAEILARFTEVVRPMFRLVHQLHLQNLNLRATRDLLLPRLLSGQLSLAEVEDNSALVAESAALPG